ncbi:MAG: nucleoside triphosphate pyrophosphohydrolase [Anaerolineales bacterium]|nr:nucleoside triphosphate pyrophosphohydrolase [Anaerolineales bacterium]
MDFNLMAATFEKLRLTPPPKLILLEAREFTPKHYPPTPPDADTLILKIDSPELALQVKTILLAVYPPSHAILCLENNQRKETTLGGFSFADCLYLPALGEGTSFESFAEIVAHLRAPNGCPWDREQTHQTLRAHLLGEAYEVLAALDENDVDSMREEFGDLLLQIVLNSQIASETGEFNLTQVIQRINEKLIRRHPHVFGETKVAGAGEVLQNWEKLKEQERSEKQVKKGILDGVPAALPALNQAQEYQDRAARIGFDWPQIDGVLEKVKEEMLEIEKAETDFETASEIGDLFFVLVNFARWKKVDAESVLRAANLKFKKRFAFIERGAQQKGKNLSEMNLAEMDALWNEAKRTGL